MTYERCASEFEAYVGIPYDESRLEIQTWDPDQTGWNGGYRQVGCVAFFPDGHELEQSLKDPRQ